MRITFDPLVLLVGVFTLAVSSEEPTSPFRLLSATSNRAKTWSLNVFVEIDKSCGNVVVNKTAGYLGFESYIQPSSIFPSGSPVGRLFSKGTKPRPRPGILYLFPLGPLSAPNTTAIHYQLQFSESIPNHKGVLSTKFTHFQRGCGLNCRYESLDYGTDITDSSYGYWYIIREEKNGQIDSPVWNLRWVAPVNATAGEFVSFPQGAMATQLWIQ